MGFLKSEPFEGDCEGYSVKTMEEEFPISYYPLIQTEFLFYSKEGKFKKIMQSILPFVQFGLCHIKYKSIGMTYLYDTFLNQKARDKYEDEKNKQFDYSMFHHR